MANKKRYSEIVVYGMTFSPKSLANTTFVDLFDCGDVEDFGLTAMDVLTNPRENLKLCLLKLKDAVKPDGLSICQGTIAAWQSKYKKSSIGIAELRKALQSLNPYTYFQSNTTQRNDWLAQLDQSPELRNIWTNKLIRVRVKLYLQLESLLTKLTGNCR